MPPLSRHTAGAPLTRAGGRFIARGSQNDAIPKEEPSQSLKAEPATDDEPLSSSEEESDSERLRKQEEEEEEERKKEEDRQAEQKVAKDISKKGAGKRKRDDGNKSNPPSSSTPREDDGSFFGGIRSSQKSSSQGYGNKSSGNKPAVFQMPQEVYLKDRKFESFENFKNPKKITIASPRKSQKKTRGSTANGSKKKKDTIFRMPAPLKEDPSDNMPLSVSHFKEPPGQSTTSAPSSAYTAADFDFDFDDLSSLSSPPSELASLLSADDDEYMQNAPAKIDQSLCPNCNAPVNPEILREYLLRPNRRLKDDRLFCESHKMNTAEKDWTDNKYPTIDWDVFDKRIQEHLSELERLLVPNPSTFFRGRFESTLSDGQAKVFKFDLEGDSIEGLSCGYYGPQGANKMLVPLQLQYNQIFKLTCV